MNNLNSKTIGLIVAEDYRTAAVFKSAGIDFCCGGNKTLDEVCLQNNINRDELTHSLEDAVKESSNMPNYQQWAPDLLAVYIEKVHHKYVEEKSIAIKEYLDKLCRVHGSNHPELFQIRDLFSQSAGDLAKHMKKEELILFPAIKQMTALLESHTKMESVKLRSVLEPIEVMNAEHDNEGERFREITRLTNNYTVPADGCNTYRVTFALLKEFESDLHLHIHLENNILFPKAQELEKQLQL